ncbi:hypothetical protein [Burkholderia ambifaria]|uniref:hypothetical protein n=1 Tax=Burkholderia ambifaria TaxID=152480 RepID=UPI001FC874E9|nr:hypothetical protein [Burkholderia ambifaria]
MLPFMEMECPKMSREPWHGDLPGLACVCLKFLRATGARRQLGAGLGLAALFLYLGVTSKSTTGAAITVVFGSMFAIPASIIPLALAVGTQPARMPGLQ